MKTKLLISIMCICVCQLLFADTVTVFDFKTINFSVWPNSEAGRFAQDTLEYVVKPSLRWGAYRTSSVLVLVRNQPAMLQQCNYLSFSLKKSPACTTSSCVIHLKKGADPLQIISVPLDTQWQTYRVRLFHSLNSLQEFGILPQTTEGGIWLDEVVAFAESPEAGPGADMAHFCLEYEHAFTTFDAEFFEQPEPFTWNDNLAGISANNARIADSVLELRLTDSAGAYADAGTGQSKACLYTGAELRSKQYFTYGRFEICLKTLRKPGTLSSFFLYGYNPWLELDIEFPDTACTRSVYFNKYYNASGNLPNQDPFRMFLDSSTDSAFHVYAIEWTSAYVRMFVDDNLAYEYTKDIPDRPMQVRMNIWAPQGDWAGTIVKEKLPAKAYYKWFKYYSYNPEGCPSTGLNQNTKPSVVPNKNISLVKSGSGYRISGLNANSQMLTVVDVSGQTVCSVPVTHGSCYWDGTNGNKRRCPSGTYFIVDSRSGNKKAVLKVQHVR